MKLPLPNLISIISTSVSDELRYNDSSIVISDDISVTTANNLAIYIDENQLIGINTSNVTSQLNVNSNTNDVIQLTYQGNYPTVLGITSNGYFSIDSTNTLMNSNFNITTHDGLSNGLYLNSVLVTSNAQQINYNNVTPGTAEAGKTLVLNSSSNISGINSLSSTSLIGTIQTANQPNITSVNTLNVVNSLSLASTLITSSANQLNYVNVTPGIAYTTKALVTDSNRSIANINEISATSLTGVLQTTSQPNVTSVGELTNLLVTNTIGIGRTPRSSLEIMNILGNTLKLSIDDDNYSDIDVLSDGTLYLSSTSSDIRIAASNNLIITTHNGVNGLYLNNVLVTSSAQQINYNNITTIGTAEASKSLVLDASGDITGINSLSATLLIGTIQTANQPNITSVNTLNVVTSLSLAGTLITSSADQLNYVDTTPGTVEASKAMVVDSNRSITNINSLTCTSLYGTIIYNSQPNITELYYVNIKLHNGVNGLYLNSVLVTSSADQLNYVDTTPGTVEVSKAMVVDSNRSITNINSLTCTSLYGTLITSSQPNISSVNTLNIVNHNGSTVGLKLGGVLVTSTAYQLNYVDTTYGVADARKALITDDFRSITNINVLSAGYLTGIIQTANQPNITSVNTLNIANHNGVAGLSLNGELVTINASQFNTLDVVPGTATANKVILLSTNKNITGINALTANTLSGLLTTGIQSYIYQVNNLNIAQHNGVTGLSLGNILVTSTATQLNYVNVVPGTAVHTKAVILDSSKNITGINSLVATALTGTLQTATQLNINTVNTLNIAQHNGVIGLALNGVMITASAAEINRIDTSVGSAEAAKALVVDSLRNINNINNLTASTLTGSIQTSNQPNITSVNTLDIVNHDGFTQGLRLGGSLVSVTTSQLNYLSTTPGTAQASKSLVTNSSNSISGLNTLSVNSLITQTITTNGAISNYSTGGIMIKSYSSVDLVGRIVDNQILNTLNFNNFQPGGISTYYSSEIIGYIKAEYSETYTFFIQVNDRVRLWVNNTLLLHSWVLTSGERISSTIYLTAGVWVPIYIQYQVDDSPSLLVVYWSSPHVAKEIISSTRLAWDNNPSNHSLKKYIQDSLNIYNSTTSLINNTSFTVDNAGDLTIDSSGNDILFGSTDNIRIPSHNGSTTGLYLGGTLVTSTAYELNYLKVSQGIALGSHALVVDGSKSIIGLGSLSATTLSCTNLSSTNFTITNLALSGPLSNYNVGGLIIKQIDGPDMKGRIVNVASTTTLSLSDYDPMGLTSYYSLEISGFIKPVYTEDYTFHVIADDRARLWVNDVLILNIWDTSTGLEYTSNTISLTSNQWVRIYIQYQNLTGTSTLQVKWSSSSTPTNFINQSYMAWDNSFMNVASKLSTSDSLTLYNTSNILSIRSSTISIDNDGILELQTYGSSIDINSNNNLNVASHNGSTSGLLLGGTLVQATAAELNYLANVTAGTAVASAPLVVDSSIDIVGINHIGSTIITGILTSGPQPNITSIGSLIDLTITGTFLLNTGSIYCTLLGNSTTTYLQSGTSNTVDSANDIFIGNVGTTTSTSTRKIMIKDTGDIGIHTIVPNRPVSINSKGSDYTMRFINDNSVGTETTDYADIGVDSSGNLLLTPFGVNTYINSNLLIGKTNQTTLSVSSGVLGITTQSGVTQIGNTTDTDLPLEIGTIDFSLTGTHGFINSSGATGSLTDVSIYSYSLRTAGRIVAGGEIDIVSDRRSKVNVKNLNTDFCKNFICNTNPISFNYINSKETNLHYGYIAQDVYKAGFPHLVSKIPDKDMKESIESDGFVNPDKEKFTLCYDQMIPIIAGAMRELYIENVELKKSVQQVITENKELKNKIESIYQKVMN